MKLTELAKPYMKWKMQFDDNFRYLYDKIQEVTPDIEPKIYKSTLDEEIITTRGVEGDTETRKYVLKAANNGKKFSYEHELKPEDNLVDIRQLAWQQKEAWEYKITENLKQTTNGEITQS